jgi:hypothetical protein
MKNILTVIITLALFVAVCSAKCTDMYFNSVTQRDSTMDLDSAYITQGTNHYSYKYIYTNGSLDSVIYTIFSTNTVSVTKYHTDESQLLNTAREYVTSKSISGDSVYQIADYYSNGILTSKSTTTSTASTGIAITIAVNQENKGYSTEYQLKNDTLFAKDTSFTNQNEKTSYYTNNAEGVCQIYNAPNDSLTGTLAISYVENRIFFSRIEGDYLNTVIYKYKSTAALPQIRNAPVKTQTKQNFDLTGRKIHSQNKNHIMIFAK